ncbi:MAG: ABC transporter ATP-binding protein [Desulfitobacteriaceae bacterium]|nr:ABC transporter ATP-binding protein [Desulfitobacteriaceae bacterium]MDD4583876.1 ABC transporter ATP-binding protein [Eubacteriales bacterium]
MIVVKDLSYSYTPEKQILKNINLCINEGEALGIIGLSGCGKTTLCHCLCGLIPHALGGIVSGSVLYEGKDLKEMTMAKISKKIGIVFQNPDNQIVATTVEDEIAFGLENLCIPQAEIVKTVNEYLKMFNMEDSRLLNPNHLSGGQKQMLAIAGVVAMKPKALILDEPMSHLDQEGKHLVKSLLLKLKDVGISLVIVEHDAEKLDFIDRIYELQRGELICL